MSDCLKACVLTVSDSCFNGVSEDKSGPLLADCLQSKGFSVVKQTIVADNHFDIQQIIKSWTDSTPVDLIITTGGTGFTPRDVTPEATMSLLDREAPGIAYALIGQSLNSTPMAMLSRLKAGIRGNTLIMNFPGSAKACNECFTIVEPVLKHAIDQLRNNRNNISVVHKSIQQITSSVRLESVGSRPRKSRFEMISMDSAINRIIAEIIAIEDTEIVSINDLNQSNRRILSKDVGAEIPIPPFRASIKDGYAVIAADGSGQRQVMPMVSTAGQSVQSIQLFPGFCMRISTGAPLPKGSDAVVQVEDTEIVEMSETGEEKIIEILSKPIVGQDIRPIGCDIAADGQPILFRSTHLGAIELALLASIGVHQIPVIRRPVVAVLSTGDEIVNPGQPLSSGQIWDSNRTLLISLLRDSGVQVLDLGIVRDELNPTYDAMRRGLLSADVLITTGGVSMGEKDIIKQIMATDFGAVIHFGRVNLKPGKPTTFATCHLNGHKKYIFGLPGNPISAFVTFHVFVEPLLICLSGRASADPTADILTYQSTIKVRLSWGSNGFALDERPEFARAIITYGEELPVAVLTGNQRSSRLMSAKEANALVLLPPKCETLRTISTGHVITAIII